MITSRYWPIIGITVLVSLITGAVASIPWLGLVASFFLAPISMGLIIYFTDIADGTPTSMSKMFTDVLDGRYYLRRVGGYAAPPERNFIDAPQGNVYLLRQTVLRQAHWLEKILHKHLARMYRLHLHFLAPSMIVYYFHILGSAIPPDEAYPPLVVDAD